MGKKIIVMFVICFLSLSSIALAEEPSLTGFTCSKGGFFSDEFNEEVDRYKEDDANMAEKFMTSQLQNLWNIGDINGLSTLVFGNPYCVWADNAFKDESSIKMAPDGIFTAVEREKIITPALKMFSAVYVALMALAMMISGLKLGFNSVRGRGLSEFGEDAKMWLLSMFFIAGYGIITNMIFELNAAIVLSFKGLLESQGVKADSFSIMGSWHDLVGVGSGGIPILSLLIVVLAEWILAIVLNFVYIARKVIVLVLLILGFVAGYSLLFARTRAFFGTWMRELLGNVFLQSIHALLLFGMAMFASMGASTIYKLGLMMMFIPLTGMISKWLKIGDTSSKMGSALTMVGLGGVMTTMALTSQAGNVMRGGNMSGGLSTVSSSNSASNDSVFGGSSISAAGGGSDSSITSITTDASGASSDSWMNSKNTLSNIGGAVFGAAGIVAGPAGAIMGAKLGKSVTGGLLQAPRNIASGIGSASNILKSAKGFNDGAGNTGLKGMMGNLGQRRQFYGNMGESLGAMVGAGAAGRKIGLGMSGVSRQRLSATSIANGGRGMTTDASGAVLPTSMASLAKQYPGANMQYVQTNKGSSMWVQTPNQDWKQVGLTGAADPLMKDGAARVMDYKLAQANTSYDLQANGSYKASRNMDSPMANASNPMAGGTSVNLSSMSGTTTIANAPAFVPHGGATVSGMNTPITSQQAHGNSVLSRSTTLSGGSTTISGTSTGSTSSTSSTGNIPLTRSTTLSTGSTGNTPLPIGPSTGSTGNTSLPTRPSIGSTGNTPLPTRPSIGSTGNTPLPTGPSIGSTGNSPLPTGPSPSASQFVQGGLPGSTPHVMRASNAYTVGVGGDGTINQDTLRSVNSVSAVRVSDAGFKGDRINPDAFVAHHIPGTDQRTSSDRVADKVHSTQQTSSKVKKSWSKAVQGGKKERSTRIS